MHNLPTIFALSTAKGKAGIAIFRISGPDSLTVLAKLTLLSSAKINQIFEPRKLYYRKIYEYSSRELIDNAMVVYFSSPASFTGEEVIEIHVHGSIAIVNLLSASLLSTGDVRPAERGEFARRAFLNNKFDLTAAEGLADLIEAETKYQHKQALAQTAGRLADIYQQWRAELLRVISLLEAYIDFPDEDIPENIILETNKLLANLANKIHGYLNDNRRGEILRSGIILAIIGAPNVGKSTLLNFLLQKEAAIVSDTAGTTRDIIEGHLDIGGYPIILQDTAGIRKKYSDAIEEEGIKRSMTAAAKADLKIIMFDNNEDAHFNEELLAMNDDNTIMVLNKIDLNNRISTNITKNFELLNISLKNNLGLTNLLSAIEHKAKNLVRIDEAPPVTRARHRKLLEMTLEALANFNLQHDLILATEDIRIAARHLGSITGLFTVEEILGEIFANFCIGK